MRPTNATRSVGVSFRNCSRAALVSLDVESRAVFSSCASAVVTSRPVSRRREAAEPAPALLLVTSVRIGPYGSPGRPLSIHTRSVRHMSSDASVKLRKAETWSFSCFSSAGVPSCSHAMSSCISKSETSAWIGRS